MRTLLARWGNTTIEALILGSVLMATFSFGGVLAWGFAAAFGQLALACCCWAAMRVWVADPAGAAVRRGGRHSEEVPPLPTGLRLILVLLALCAGYFILQLVPLPASWVRAVAPQRAVLAARVQEGLGLAPERWLTVSIEAESTRQALAQFGLTVLAFWAGLYAGAQRHRARRIVLGLIVLVLIEAIYGLVENLSYHDHVLWLPSLSHAATGTFINRNDYAAMLALFAPLASGWLLFRASEPVYLKGFNDYRTPGLWEVLGSRRGLWLLAPAVLLLGVIQSESRGGLSSIILGIALFFAFNLRGRLGRSLAWLAALTGLVLIVYGMNSQYELVMGRLGTMTRENYVEGRVIIWRDSLKMLRDFPIFGVGLGNFGLAFKPYSSVDTFYFPDQAHNEWLEALLTMGWLGFPLFLALCAGLARAIVRNLRVAGRDRLWLLGGGCGVAGLAVHCLVEFNFHIPAINLTASLLIGILTGFQPRASSHPALRRGLTAPMDRAQRST